MVARKPWNGARNRKRHPDRGMGMPESLRGTERMDLQRAIVYLWLSPFTCPI